MKLNSQVFSVLDNNTTQTDSPLRPHTNVSSNTHSQSENRRHHPQSEMGIIWHISLLIVIDYPLSELWWVLNPFRLSNEGSSLSILCAMADCVGLQFNYHLIQVALCSPSIPLRGFPHHCWKTSFKYPLLFNYFRMYISIPIAKF